MKPSPAVAALLGALALAGCTPQPDVEPTPEPTAQPVVAELGEALAGDGWEVVIGSVTLDADEQVAAANEFNPAPGEGERYALVGVTITRTIAPAAAPLDVGIAIVDGETVYAEAPAQAPTQLHLLTPLEKDAAATGELAYLLPTLAHSLRVQVTIPGAESVYLVDAE